MAAIGIGVAATDRAGLVAAAKTRINLGNPANLPGLITSVDLWFAASGGNATGVRVGTFYLVSGVTYKCRSSQTIGAVTAGSKHTFAVKLAVQAGDFIGMYCDAGSLERDDSGSGDAYISGEYIDPGDQADFTVRANTTLSLYGSGITQELRHGQMARNLVAVGAI